MSDQSILSIAIITLLGLFIWSKYRYDALAAGALVILIILGVIPANQAFDGFAHPAVITVALVLIISQGLKNSGLTGLVGKLIGGRSFTKFQFFSSPLSSSSSADFSAICCQIEKGNWKWKSPNFH